MLANQNPYKHNLRFMKECTLDCFSYMLQIFDSIEMKREARRKKALEKQEAVERKRRRLFVEKDPESCFLCGTPFTPTQIKHSLPFVHLLFMPQQEMFLEKLGDSVPYETKERLLLSNRELPPFLRILIPAVTTVDLFKRLQLDKEWMAQTVQLSKDCYHTLAKQIVHLAKQSERLEEVQT